jgi:hypothetical protein
MDDGFWVVSAVIIACLAVAIVAKKIRGNLWLFKWKTSFNHFRFQIQGEQSPNLKRDQITRIVITYRQLPEVEPQIQALLPKSLQFQQINQLLVHFPIHQSLIREISQLPHHHSTTHRHPTWKQLATKSRRRGSVQRSRVDLNRLPFSIKKPFLKLKSTSLLVDSFSRFHSTISDRLQIGSELTLVMKVTREPPNTFKIFLSLMIHGMPLRRHFGSPEMFRLCYRNRVKLLSIKEKYVRTFSERH